MTKLIWMSDPHFSADADVLGHDPTVRLQAAIAHINAHHTDAAYCVISGDLVNRGTLRDYQALQGLLSQLTIPYLPMAGNHDDRTLLRQSLVMPDTAMQGFVQYQINVGSGQILCLDTQEHGTDSGVFCGARQAWLRDTLAQDLQRPTILFMHHPPMPLGLPMQDQDKMENGTAFLELVAAYPNVRFMCIGHVHRPTTGVIRGTPFATMRSVLYQAPAPHPAWDWDSFTPAKEAPNIGVLTLQGNDVTLQYEQFCQWDIGAS